MKQLDLNELPERVTRTYYKLPSNGVTVFKLVNTEYKEIKKIWDNREESIKNTTKKFYVSGDEIIQANGKTVTFDVAIKVKNEEFKEAFDDKENYPNNKMSREFKHEYVINIDDEEMIYSMPHKASKALQTAIETAEGNDLNPLEQFFKLTKEGKGVTTTYSVTGSKRHPDGDQGVTPSVKSSAGNTSLYNLTIDGDKTSETYNGLAPDHKAETIMNVDKEPINDMEKKLVDDFNAGTLKFLNDSLVPLNKPGFIKAYSERSGGDEIRADYVWSKLVEIKK